MDQVRREAYTQALQSISGGVPRKLESRALAHFDDESFSDDRSIGSFIQELVNLDVNDGLRVRFHIELGRWDNAEVNENWTEGTDALTVARRQVINTSLGVPEELHTKLDDVFPIPTPSAVVVSKVFEPWYDRRDSDATSFYWDAYRNYLVSKRGWPAESVVALDAATSKVVERLADPSRESSYRAKGLVVGYVQSGKTANFTGVVSKAIDAGYRLIIVLTGTVDILREQTQRRFDMELVGKENILRNVQTSDPTELAKVDYYTDADWDELFLEHGLLPSSGGNPDIIRLTGHRFDYKSLRAGITALEFEKADRNKPLNHKLNLARSNTRLLIVKKNAAVLDKLIKDLRKITTPLDEIPALLIDDESDQASVNTTDPKNWVDDRPETEERTRINGSITKILNDLKRCQYVGYTATPFANVFIDPSNEEDLFPADFLLSLDKAPGYMGASDFHDLDWPDDTIPKTVENSNEKRFVRDLHATDQKIVDLELRDAIDTFVLTGAIKLYRESVGEGSFRHHTMLVHETVKQADHRKLRDRIVKVWNEADYSGPRALSRLRALYLDDVIPVSSVIPSCRLPESFEELKSFIGASNSRISSDGGPVIVVNGDKEISPSLSFESHPVWKILVGGAKLSRGFTVEGLTITYYKRKVNTADSLMQMGRWFGFRRGYQDLVRLFIQRSNGSATGQSRQLDLYKSFEAIVRDEEQFRSQLQKYSVMVDGEPQVTPREVPPLVAQHLPYLRPTAKSKMFNAKLHVRKVAGEFVIPYAYPISAQASKKNFELLTPLVQKCAGHHATFGVPLNSNGTGAGKANCFYSIESSQNMVNLLTQLEWLSEDYKEPELNHLKQLGDRVSDWVVLMPQLNDAIPCVEIAGVGTRSVFKRSRRKVGESQSDYWGETTDPRHRRIAERIVGALPECNDSVTDGLHSPKRAAMLLYPIFEKDPKPSSFAFRHEDLTLAVAWILPSSVVRQGERLVQFVARNLAEEQKIILDSNEVSVS